MSLNRAVRNTDHASWISPPEDIISAAGRGEMVIMVDDEDRENEGDLVIPATFSDAGAVNFMAREGRGLICLAMNHQHIEQLGLQLMAQQNSSRHQTAFTVSIEAREGVTTGISAADRARTIQAATQPDASPEDLASPGHVFPLQAREGGVLVRAGHTEAAVDIARLAGLFPAGVICEIMKDNGDMARLDDLIDFARHHDMKIGTIADLIAYRRRTEKLVECILKSSLESRYGGAFDLYVYRNTINGAEHIALSKGDISAADDSVLVRMHAMNVMQDVLGEGDPILERAMRIISDRGAGVVVLIREPDKSRLSDQVMADGHRPAGKGQQLRDYGVGAQILQDLGVQRLRLLTNTPKTVVGLEGYGLHIDGQIPVTS